MLEDVLDVQSLRWLSEAIVERLSPTVWERTETTPKRLGTTVLQFLSATWHRYLQILFQESIDIVTDLVNPIVLVPMPVLGAFVDDLLGRDAE